MFRVKGRDLACRSVCLNELCFLSFFSLAPRYFFTYLLPHQAPPGLTHLVDHIMNSTGEPEQRERRRNTRDL